MNGRQHFFFFFFEALLFYLINITKAKKRYVNVRIQLSDFDEEKHFEDGKGKFVTCFVILNIL